MPDTLQNGQTFEDFHREQIVKYVGFRAAHVGTHFDDMIKAIDSLAFTTHMQIDEQDRAHDIEYTHGLELDDIGVEDYQIERNGLDDETYRFLIQAHRLSNESKGTWHDIKAIAANLLGCKPQDVEMVNSRQFKDGELVGDPNTVEIVDVDVTKITHANLLDMLASELQNAMCGGYHVKQIGFTIPVKTNAYVGIGLTAHAEMDLTVPPDVSATTRMSVSPVVGIGLKFDYYFEL
jgi:restriction endonuclease Mrr